MHETYKSKKVLVTGHTGFKGSWLSLWLNKIGAEVVGVSDRIPSAPSNFEVNQIYDLVKDVRLDLLDTDSILNLVREEKPDFIFHLAAQALVRPSYEDPLKTLKVRDRNCQIVKRRGRLYVINKRNPRFKARQG